MGAAVTVLRSTVDGNKDGIGILNFLNSVINKNSNIIVCFEPNKVFDHNDNVNLMFIKTII